MPPHVTISNGMAGIIQNGSKARHRVGFKPVREGMRQLNSEEAAAYNSATGAGLPGILCHLTLGSCFREVTVLANVLSAAIVGVEAHLVDVEVDISSGLPQFSIVGLPDATVRESRDRVRAALKNSGFHFPIKKITVNLAPANIKKEGAGLDLAIALGILAAEEILSPDAVKGQVFVGELSLDGRLKPIPGALSIGVVCRHRHRVLISAENAEEAALVEGTEVFPIHTLPQAVEFLRGAQAIAPLSISHNGKTSAGVDRGG